MKTLSLASILCLVCTWSVRAQEQTPVVPQVIHPPYISPQNVGVWPVIQGIQNSHGQHVLLVPRQLKMARSLLKGLDAADTGVCSVPLTQARTDANDPGIATAPMDHSVAIRQAHLPAPPCKRE